MKYLLSIIILIFATSIMVQAQVTSGSEVLDDIAPLLLLLLVMLGVIALCTLIAIGILLAIFLMVTLGILSASVILGIYTKSLATGKKFFVICYTVACSLFGGAVLWALNYYYNLYKTEEIILVGVALGLIAGFVSGLILLFYLKRLAAWLRTKITIQTIPK